MSLCLARVLAPWQSDAHGTPHELILRESAKYLGYILHVTASCRAELRNRTSQANTVHGRVTPRESGFVRPPALKVRRWKSLVLSKCFHALVRVLSRADLFFLERWQIRKVRHLARSPVHPSRESNETLRRRGGVPTVESQLRVWRLKWWRK